MCVACVEESVTVDYIESVTHECGVDHCVIFIISFTSCCTPSVHVYHHEFIILLGRVSNDSIG